MSRLLRLTVALFGIVLLSISIFIPMSRQEEPVMQQLIFETRRDGEWQLYLTWVDGSWVEPFLDENTDRESTPSWSPDGEWIAYSSYRAGGAKLFRASPRGDDIQQISYGAGNDWSPTWSPTGDAIIFPSNRQDQNFELYSLSFTDNSLKQLTNHQGADTSPAWSPNGQWIAFSSEVAGDINIFMMRPDGSQITQITDHPSDEVYPSWSPDNQHIVFEAYRNGSRDIFIIDVFSGDVSQLTSDAASDSLPVWSPDGEWISFVSSRNGSRSIFIIRPDGSDLQQITGNEFNDWMPRWRPIIDLTWSKNLYILLGLTLIAVSFFSLRIKQDNTTIDTIQ